MSEQTKASYVGAPASFILDQACHWLREAFPDCGIYLVGSATERPDFRDVDIRLMLEDEEYRRLFGDPRFHEQNGLWSMIAVTVSEHLTRLSGVPVDFQVQETSYANQKYGSRPRHAIGIWIKPEVDS